MKVLGTLLFIVSNLLIPDGAWAAFGLAWLLLVVANVAAGLGAGYTLVRSFIALPFALPAATMVFSMQGQPLAEWHLGPWAMTPTDAGAARFASILTRSWLSVQMGILLVSTTAFPDIARALKRLGVPGLLVAVMSLMYRYLFVLADEAERLLRARNARSAAPARDGLQPEARKRRHPGIVWQARIAGSMAGQLFVRSYDRSERVYQAMLARGYRGELVVLDVPRLRPGDWSALAGLGLALTVVQTVARLGW